MVLTRRIIFFAIPSLLTGIFLISHPRSEVTGIKGEPVPAQVVEWKDMVARDQAKNGIKQTPTVVPLMPLPGPLQVPKDAKIGPAGPPSQVTNMSPSAPFAAPATSSFS